MTRPIYEPTPDRTDADLSYATQQLFRRPAPDKPDVDEHAWGRMKTTVAQEIPDTTTTQITFAADLALVDWGGCVDIIEPITDGFLLAADHLYGIQITGQWVEESGGNMWAGKSLIEVTGGFDQIRTEEFAIYESGAGTLSRVQRATGFWITGTGTISNDSTTIYAYAWQASGSQQKMGTFFITVVELGAMCPPETS